MLCAYFVGSAFTGTDVMYLCRLLIISIFFLFLEPHEGTNVIMLRLFILPFIYFCLLIFKFWDGIENFIPDMCRLYLPIFSFNVGLLTLIDINLLLL